MDPATIVGVAAATTQFAGQIIKLALSIAQFYSNVKEAPGAVRQQLLHIEQLSGIARLIIQNASPTDCIYESCLGGLSAAHDKN